MSASEPRIVSVHGLCGPPQPLMWAHYGHTCSEERAATHLTLYGAAGAVRAAGSVRAPHAWSHAVPVELHKKTALV
jgi:hypothetical protein